MIAGVGIDIIEVARIKEMVEKNPRFLKRVFTPQEIDYCTGKKNKYQNLAARFTAKEAFFKALGNRIPWTEVGVINLHSGKPNLEFRSQEKLSFKKAEISLSHLQEYAIAVVVLES
jgi:holo-[acyl-carrier protein] synthase